MVTPEVMKDTVLIDGGLVAMQFMLAARAHGYDTCPIGGFEKDQIAEAFGLDKSYVVMLISTGKLQTVVTNQYVFQLTKLLSGSNLIRS